MTIALITAIVTTAIAAVVVSAAVVSIVGASKSRKHAEEARRHRES